MNIHRLAILHILGIVGILGIIHLAISAGPVGVIVLFSGLILSVVIVVGYALAVASPWYKG